MQCYFCTTDNIYGYSMFCSREYNVSVPWFACTVTVMLSVKISTWYLVK